MDNPKILILDIETFPMIVYTWGLWDQNVGLNQILENGKLAAWAAKWYKQRGVSYLDIRNETMLQTIWNLLDEADIVVHYNGQSFDIPTLNAEFLRAGLSPPSPYRQIDLFRVIKQEFRFPSNKLEYVALATQIGRKLATEGFKLWADCMKGDERAWSKMERYNRQDVRLTEKLYNVLRPWIRNHPSVAIFTTTEKGQLICPTCGGKHLEKRGLSRTNTMTYQRYHCLTCNKWSRGRTSATPRDLEKPMLTN